MTTRKRPSLRDNLTEGGDETARQIEQAAELEQVRAAAAAAADPAPSISEPAPEPAKSAFEEAPSPVAALAHAYMHGSGGTAGAKSSGRGLTAAAAVLGLAAVGLAGAAGFLAYKDYKDGRMVVAAAPAAAPATVAPPVLGGAPAAPASAPAAAPAAPAAAPVAEAPRSIESTIGSVLTGGLTDRVSTLEKQVGQISGSSQVVSILAARQLRGALVESTPFSNELALARLSGVATGDLGKALERVAPRAAEGIPTRPTLIAHFAVLGPAVLNAELEAAGAGSGAITAVGETVWGWVTGVASVLRLPVSLSSEEESKSAVALTRAGVMLEAGDLNGAIDLVASLDGPAAKVAAPWVSDARARAAADQAGTLLANRITELLGAGKR